MRGEYSLADIKAVTDGNNYNDGFGGGSGWWIIILILLFGYGRNGWGNGNGGGGQVGDNYVLASDFSQLSRQLSDGLAGLERKGDIINGGLCDGFYAQNTTLLNGFSGVNSNISNGVYNLTNAITTNGFETRNAITQDTIANMQNANALQSQIANCCCDVKGILNNNLFEVSKGFCNTNNTINTGFNGLQQAMCLNTRDIIENQNANYRNLHDELVAIKLENKAEQVANLQNEVNALRLSASQTAQNQYLVDKLQYPKCPIPAYTVPNPYCNCNNGCACGM